MEDSPRTRARDARNLAQREGGVPRGIRQFRFDLVMAQAGPGRRPAHPARFRGQAMLRAGGGILRRMDSDYASRRTAQGWHPAIARNSATRRTALRGSATRYFRCAAEGGPREATHRMGLLTSD